MDDPLLSFFDEISKVEEVVSTNIDNTTTTSNTETDSNKRGRDDDNTANTTIVKRAKIVAASAPAVVSVSSAPVINDPYQFSTSSIPSLPSSSLPSSSLYEDPKNYVKQNKKQVRSGGGDVWIDDTLNDWPENDHRLFIGDIGKDVTADMLEKQFNHYKSFVKTRLVKPKYETKGRGYGFVSFLDPLECAKAFREQQGKYLGSRPMTIQISKREKRDINQVKKKEKKEFQMKKSLGLI